ncbi:alpha/beta fold hydrolase [Streptococcus suis]|uniref:alpha/beta hydrolase n=1 Tax=Streptococcus suis TaxID=1307 RepID=UPI001ABBED9D|nr:alpha/beta fold hydrolase [Streptococcus suis]MBO3641625.1 alpha/beta fold hydrolase [Streptococcus suis]
MSIFALALVIMQQKNANSNKQTTSQTSNSELTIEQSSTQTSETTSSSTLELEPTEDIVSENYMVEREGANLYGVVTASRNYKNENRPLVIISHGFNNTLEMYEEYADYLARLGFIVYRFDFYGGSHNSKSGGTDMLSMSVLTEKKDLSAVVEKLSKESFVNADNITLLGASQGGVVSTLYAAENPALVKNLVLIFPAFVLFDDVKETYANLGVSSTDQIPAVITHKNAQLGSIYLKDALGVDIDSEIKKVTSPVLIVQGTNDEVVPYQYAVEANQLFPSSDLVTVEGGVHWIDNNFNQVAIPAIEQFLKR